mgnify:CR=1 FL=1
MQRVDLAIIGAGPAGMAATRAPLQAGAELFGHAGIDADVEVISLMLETLAIAGRTDVHLDLGHVGIYRGLVAEAALDAAEQSYTESKDAVSQAKQASKERKDQWKAAKAALNVTPCCSAIPTSKHRLG